MALKLVTKISDQLEPWTGTPVGKSETDDWVNQLVPEIQHSTDENASTHMLSGDSLVLVTKDEGRVRVLVCQIREVIWPIHDEDVEDATTIEVATHE